MNGYLQLIMKVHVYIQLFDKRYIFLSSLRAIINLQLSLYCLFAIYEEFIKILHVYLIPPYG